MSDDIVTEAGDGLPTPAQELDGFIGRVDGDKRVARGTPESAEPLEKFRKYVYDNSEIYVLFADMFEELSRKVTPVEYPQVRSFEHLLELIGEAIRAVPAYNDSGLVGLPVNAILNCAMGTRAGFAAFLHKGVNERLGDVLDEWARYLKSRDSLKGLKEEGWLSGQALEAMSDPGVKFEELFDCDPDDDYYGFESWNHFFTRNFRDTTKYRPVAGRDDDNVVVAACEATPYRLSREVRV